jgi:hypothetical protein
VDFQDEVFRDLKQLRVVAVGLQKERQHIEAALGGLPALLDADLHSVQVQEFYHQAHRDTQD